MIDKEFEIYNDLAEKIRETYPLAFITSSYINSTPTFPAITIIQESNFINSNYSDSKNKEYAVNVMFEINVYSDNGKIEVKKIMEIVCDEMTALGFTRTSLDTLPNIEDTIYRMVGRFNTVIDKNGMFYNK